MPGRNLVESGRADAVGGVRASGRVVVPIYSGSKPDWLAEGSAVVEHGGQIGISALHLEWIYETSLVRSTLTAWPCGARAKRRRDCPLADQQRMTRPGDDDGDDGNRS